jgi:hypothetical protein
MFVHTQTSSYMSLAKLERPLLGVLGLFYGKGRFTQDAGSFRQFLIILSQSRPDFHSFALSLSLES